MSPSAIRDRPESAVDRRAGQGGGGCRVSRPLSLRQNGGVRMGRAVRLIGGDGSRPRVLLERRGGEYPYDLTWSPDGKLIAAAVTDYGTDKTSQIVLISVPEGSVTRLKSTAWRSPTLGGFSRDGKFLLYDVEGSSSDGGRDILAIAMDEGSSETVLVEGPSNDSQPSWTPDGKAILFMSDRSGSPALWTMRVDNGAPKGTAELVRPNFGNVRILGFTRDGSYFYQLAERPGGCLCREAESGEPGIHRGPAPLTDRFVGSNSGAAWSADGRHVAFVRGPDDGRKFSSCARWLTAPNGPATKLLDGYFPAQQGPAWFPDSRSVLVSDTDHANRKTSFRRVDIESGQETLVFEATYGRSSALRDRARWQVALLFEIGARQRSHDEPPAARAQRHRQRQ